MAQVFEGNSSSIMRVINPMESHMRQHLMSTEGRPRYIALTISCWASLFIPVRLCNIPDDIVGARAPGDIIIGGLFPVHEKVENLSNRTQPGQLHCSGFDLSAFLQAQAMIYSIERINNSTFLPGVKLGYEIYDSCSDVITAIQATTRFLSKLTSSDSSVEVHCNYSNYAPSVIAVVGDLYSEISIVVARILTLHLIPQISYGASAEILSDKVRFPSFFRTIPSDVHQTEAMAKLVNHFKWNWVGAVASDDDYGRAGLNSFISNAGKFNICIAFQKFVSTYINSTDGDEMVIDQLTDTIKNSSAEVIILFAKVPIVIQLFTALIKQNVSKTWIASDTWSTSRQVASLHHIEEVGNIFGFSFKNGTIPNFVDYLEKLDQCPKGANRFIKEYKKLYLHCSDQCVNDTGTCDANSLQYKPLDNFNLVSHCICTKANSTLKGHDLTENIHPGTTYGVYLAITAIAHALRRILNCEQRNCNENNNLQPWQLVNELKDVNFTGEHGPFQFDSSGDFRNGYDLISWKIVNASVQFVSVGVYNVVNDEINFTNYTYQKNTEVILSNCSRTCLPGERKNANSRSPCCYECAPCPVGYYSARNNSNLCEECPEDHWSEAGSPMCQERTIEFLRWNEMASIVLITAASLGSFAIFVITIIITKSLHTPAVKAAGGWMCYIMLFSLALGFVSVVLFIGEPFDYNCKIRQPLFGVSFTLCVSCILVKSIRIILAFSFNPITRKRIKYVFKPVPIIIATTGIQVIICSMWLCLNSPQVKKYKDFPQIILLLCDEGSYVAFGAMLGYIAFLACVCFILAFKGRKAPDKYNEAKLITLSMLIYLIVWISFVPMYINIQADKYFPAIESVAILASSYGILYCHFFPNCYIICFKKESNVELKYLVHVREYFKQRGQFVCPNPNTRRDSEIYTEMQPPISVPTILDFVPGYPDHPFNKKHIKMLKTTQSYKPVPTFNRKRYGSW
ncbi:G-protein coupled receptor family C group 6 member A-like [Heterodontus francisci]|uniref:G-protein coupled receptor family C group 6 member A-like n=1 Tax=Heterodontus francisci TaxID=7792 RepID=UPI00355B7DD9